MATRVGYITSRTAELGLGIAYVKNPMLLKYITSALIGIEYARYGTKDIFGPKLSLFYHKNFLILGPAIKLNMIYYLANPEHDIRIRPEIGLSFFGRFTICYGKNFPLSSSNIKEIETDVLTVSLSLTLKKWEILQK